MAAADLQRPFDTAVVIQTLLRPSLVQAVRSVFAQDLAGRIQILIGVDTVQGDPAMLDQLLVECPGHIALTVINPGYSTSQRHGSVYSNHYGGALRTVLSYLANSRLVAYLDDDNWWTSAHLSSLFRAIDGKPWAFSLRTLVDRRTDEVIGNDDFESVGPGRGVFQPGFGGFVDTSCLMLDKLACHEVLPAWSISRFEHGDGEDRMVFERLKSLPFGTTGQYTVLYRIALDGVHPYILWKYRQAGVDLTRFMSPEKIPAESVWQECARHDEAELEKQRLAQAQRPSTPAGYGGVRYSVSYGQPPRK